MTDSNIASESPSEQRLWPGVTAVLLLVIVAVAVRWSLDNPNGIHWDEAEYLNFVHIDLQRLWGGHVLRLAGRILLRSHARPPAFRLLALPLLAVFGFHTTLARLSSLLCYCGSSFFVYRAVRRFASPVVSAFAVFIFALSPEVVSASIFYGTDASLYLATSALLYYLFAVWSESPATINSKAWIGLGLAIGLGLLAKTSFLAILLPVLAFWIACGWRGFFSIPSSAKQGKAAILALLIAGPWWALNFKDAFAYSKYARDFVRNSLGPPGFATWARWLNTVVQCLLGHAVSVLLALLAIGCVRWLILYRSEAFSPLQWAPLGACAFAGLPIVLTQLSGTNHLLRHISPAMVPLAIAAGIAADRIAWFQSRPALAVSGALCFAQFVMLMVPVFSPNDRAVDIGFNNGSVPWRVFIRFEQWDWTPIRSLSDACNLASPKISYLGNGRAFNPPQLQTPWATRAVDLPDVVWLWRYEQGPVNWQKVTDAADQSDMIITAPNYTANRKNKEDLDNQHNSEFEDRLAHDAHFPDPIHLRMGRFGPVPVDVYLNKSLACRPPLPGASNL